MIGILSVFLGGGLGAASRYGVSLLISHHTTAPHWGSTLIVNVVGSLLSIIRESV